VAAPYAPVTAPLYTSAGYGYGYGYTSPVVTASVASPYNVNTVPIVNAAVIGTSPIYQTSPLYQTVPLYQTSPLITSPVVGYTLFEADADEEDRDRDNANMSNSHQEVSGSGTDETFHIQSPENVAAHPFDSSHDHDVLSSNPLFRLRTQSRQGAVGGVAHTST